MPDAIVPSGAATDAALVELWLRNTVTLQITSEEVIMPHNGKQRVYVARCGRMYKIGRAIDPSARIKDLSTGSAYPISLWKVFLVEDAISVERWLHKAVHAYRGRGGREWFELPIWLTGWIAKQTARDLDYMAAVEEPAPEPPSLRTQAREEFIQCAHCGRSTRYRGEAFCYHCQPIVADFEVRLRNERT